MSLAREEKHLPVLIAICLAGNFVLGGIGQEFSSDSFGQIFSWQVGSLFYMAGCSLYAAKLHTDKWHISSAGFILLSIGQGIFYTIQNSVSDEQAYPLFAAGIMVFLPGMAFICYYSGFPVWLRIMGLVAIIPFIIVMVLIDLKKYDWDKNEWITAIGFALIQLTSLFWSYFALRPYKKTTTQD